MNLRDKRNYCVERLYYGSWYVYRKGGGYTYLFRDGRMRCWYRGSRMYGMYGVNKQTEFSSKRSANAALKKYLERD